MIIRGCAIRDLHNIIIPDPDDPDSDPDSNYVRSTSESSYELDSNSMLFFKINKCLIFLISWSIDITYVSTWIFLLFFIIRSVVRVILEKKVIKILKY